VIDRDRILTKLDEVDGYLVELRSIAPARLEEYLKGLEKRRACERLLQISIDGAIDVCALLVTGLRPGLPGEEDDLFEKLAVGGVISRPMAATLRRMKGLRNILMHEYGRLDDALVFDVIQTRLEDFAAFKREVLAVLRTV
jgi:uncharacterized protein YutE (UPF0331/DUF86 family)